LSKFGHWMLFEGWSGVASSSCCKLPQLSALKVPPVGVTGRWNRQSLCIRLIVCCWGMRVCCGSGCWSTIGK